MIEFLFVDVDDTILDFAWQENSAIRRTYREMGTVMTDEMYETYHHINRRHWLAFERGEMTRDFMLVERHRVMFRECGLTLDPEYCERLYRKNLGIGYQFMPNVPETLSYLKDRCRLFIASNGVAQTQYSRLESAGITPYFEKIFISEEIGALKPSREYFDRCFAQIPGFDLAKAAIVGDSPSSDLLGGKNAGIMTIWYNPKQKPGRTDIRPDLEIHDLLELKQYI